MFKGKSHSTFVIGIRRLDVGPEYRGKKVTWAPVLVLEGPTEPPCLESILQPLVDFFVAHSPGVCLLLACTWLVMPYRNSTLLSGEMSCGRHGAYELCRQSRFMSLRYQDLRGRTASAFTALAHSGLCAGRHPRYGPTYDALRTYCDTRLSPLLYSW